MNLNNSLRKTPVAVVGMSAIFADAKNLEEFWTNIITAKDSIREVPESRWKIEDYYDPDMTAPDKTYCKVGGFIPDIDFNPMEFGLPPNILEVTDASQLLGLVAARDALAHAGYGKKSAKFTKELKEKTGVILGVGGGQKLVGPLMGRLQYPIWKKALKASGIADADIPPIIEKMKNAFIGWNENSFPGLLGNVIAGRITNRFDLGGINSVVDAACAASLSAIKMALSELVEGRCDMMLTGGVDTDNSPFMYMSFSKTPAFSKSGNIRPFDDKADGMLIGEGLGILVLKRLEDAERDGDDIYAVIKGIGASSDGRFKSVYAPRSSGQALAVSRAYEEAGYEPASVGLLEAHGTGTGAGDPTEFASMQMVFGKDNLQKQHIALGSVKSQVGHTKAAAGAAGMIKAVLALHHKVLPPTINVEKPNSKFDIEESAIYINTETRPWLSGKTPRRASVSAFGFGGINVHVAMEEYTKEHKKPYRFHQPYKAILLNAVTPSALLTTCQQALQSIKSDGDIAYLNLANSSKEVFPMTNARLGFVVNNQAECKAFLKIAIETLQSNTTNWEHPKGIYFRTNGIAPDTKVVALFSGQGSQYVGMGSELVNAFPEIRKAFDQTDSLFEKEGKDILSKTIYPIPVFNKEAKQANQVELTKTQNAQPAIGTLSMGMYKTMQQAGFAPSFTAGHSFGELTALWAAGVYDEQTFLSLAKERGAAMAAQNPNAETGTMLAVKAPIDQVEAAVKILQGVTIANVNSTKQVILGGSHAAINTAAEQLKQKGFSVVPLSVSAAFHTEFVQHAQQPFAAYVATQQFNAPKIPVFSNTTSEAYPADPKSIQTILQGHILKPVLFKNQIDNIYNAGGRVFVEFGPKGVLTNLVKDILKDKTDAQAIALNPNARKDSDLQFRQAVIQLQVLGLPIGEVDKYKKEIPAIPNKTKLNVLLGGHNYVSDTTKKIYHSTLSNGIKISNGGTTVVEKVIEKIVEVPVEKIVEVAARNNSSINQEDNMNKETLALLSSTIDHFKSQQTKSLELFERFINEQNKQSEQLIQLLSTKIDDTPKSSTSLSSINGKVDKQTSPSISPKLISKTVVHSNGNGTGRNGLIQKQQQSVATNGSIPVATAPVDVAPTTAPTTGGGADRKALENILLSVISEKTGYPTEMLELGMDMEADLGIDSIKRVEIFGSMTESHPEVSGINPNELTELRTLGQIVDYLAGKGGASTVPAPSQTAALVAAAPTVTVPVAATQSAATTTDGGADRKALENILLNVISEKTGYPTEMLELGMDMEADLGIDSIKRVEIFGSMTESHPEVSGINPNELTELRTLGQIVDYLASKGGASTVVAPSQTAAPAAAPTATAPVAATQSAPATGGGTDRKALENILLNVISEKTGYPTEMLELGMDMEADLGIDSIKRVEIFGSMSHPEVSGINPNELTELRTLGQIVDYLAGKSGASTVATASQTAAPVAAAATATAPVAVAQSAAPSTGGADRKALENILLSVISEKTGYPTEMLELGMDMEADLGIDSIKRVEIFGSMTESHPEVSGINPNELTELRTLGQIVDYLAGKSGGSAVTTPSQTAAPVAATPTATAPVTTAQPVAPSTGGTDRKALENILLNVISEKTGYPTEMLELGMDMEADLGIDSIKRVEIFGSMTESHPEVSGINPNELTELRTLGQIVDYLADKSKKKVLA